MAKIKIKQWKGLYTNIDENDQAIELARTSINFKHDRGFLQFEGRELAEYAVPEIDTSLAAYDWTWETGIYCTLLNDPFEENSIAAQYNVLVLIAKAEDAGTYHRLVYLKDITNSSSWYELSKEGNADGNDIFIENHDGAGSFENSFFSTTIDGKAFFRVENGRLKLFLPHGSFWIGRLNRNIYFKGAPGEDGYNNLSLNQWYIDRLSEPFDATNQTVRIDYPLPVGSIITEENPNAVFRKALQLDEDVFAGPNRRNGLKFTVEVISNPTTVINAQTITKVFSVDNIFYGLPNMPRTDNERWKCRGYKFNLNGNPIPSPIPYGITGYDGDGTADPNVIYLPRIFPSDGTDIIMIYPEMAANYLKPVGMTWEEAAADPGTGVYIASEFSGINLEGDRRKFYGVIPYMSISDFESLPMEWLAAGQVEDVGLENIYSKYNIVATAVYDDREEYILETKTGLLDLGATEKFALQISDISIPYDFNRRTTRLRFYVKLYDLEDNPALDHTQYKEFDLLDSKNESSIPFYVYNSDDSGVLLSQNIGITFDDEKPQSHIVLSGFRDFITESGVSIGLSSNDYANVYYSSLGNGNLQPDLVYKEATIPITGVSSIKAVTVVNTKLAMLTDNTMYLLDVAEETGLLAFVVKSVLEFGVKNADDIATIQGGIAVNTKHGIYTTTGVESNLISEAIDNIVKDNFSTSRIYYNKYLHELYYKPSESEDLYRFRFKDGVWEMINKTTSDSIVEEAVVVD